MSKEGCDIAAFFDNPRQIAGMGSGAENEFLRSGRKNVLAIL